LDNVKLESSFAFDLDADNSSGLTNGDYRADTSCVASSPVVGDDPLLSSEGPIDSIRIALLVPNGLEALSLGNIPPTLLAYQYAPHLITLVNNGNASTLDFLAAIKTLQYADGSAKPLRGVRQVEFRVFADCGEAARQRTHLPIFPPPQAGLSGDTTVCEQSQPFHLFGLLGGSPDPGGYWSPETKAAPGVFSPSLDPAGVYAYILPPTKECAGDTSYITVATVSAPVLQFDTTLCFKESFVVQAPRELLDWEWSNGSKDPVILVNEPGTYSITGKTAHCDFEGRVSARFITCELCQVYVPNVFSPNDDGQNDSWQAFLPCRWLDFRVEVYDRWGSLMFAAADPEHGWDGRAKGKDAPQGVYVWQMSWSAEYLGEVKQWRSTGDVTIVR
jgi:gliding motility-associated-like protein